MTVPWRSAPTVMIGPPKSGSLPLSTIDPLVPSSRRVSSNWRTLTCLCSLVAVAMVSPFLPACAASEMIDRGVAVLQGLDKITARVSKLEVAVGETARFGTLLITPRTCREAPPIDPPDAAAFLEISEVKPDEAQKTVFSGWMFASSPALSALEHPIYDVWVTGCRDRK